ncbi:MAG: OmpA-OmpF porin, family [Blastocatellia bacterium]|jgi:outer membrane protein OmpA-like peptidoglycan-associated protein|nr:OmpA-OmpF porin, family [Blastocatellia bacterium]
MISSLRTFRSLALAFGLALTLSPLALGQTSTQSTTTRSVASGEKMKIKGVVVKRDADTFTVRDLTGNDTVVRLTDRTSVKTKGGFLRGGTNYGATNILRGLNLEVEGRGGSSGELVADSVRFNDSDLRTARAVESRATPLEERASASEGRLSEVEQNAQKLSGQLDELAAVSNAARGGAKAAQETADAAVAGVNATNDRISALDDYVPQETAAVTFRVGSSVLNAENKAKLDAIATKALNAKGYVLEVTGYADATGNTERNRALSSRRADAVIRYLVETHQIPLRRIVTPYGFGESNPVADNKTRDGRAQNRRVEVKVLVNKGLTQPAPAVTPGTSGQ